MEGEVIRPSITTRSLSECFEKVTGECGTQRCPDWNFREKLSARYESSSTRTLSVARHAVRYLSNGVINLFEKSRGGKKNCGKFFNPQTTKLNSGSEFTSEVELPRSLPFCWLRGIYVFTSRRPFSSSDFKYVEFKFKKYGALPRGEYIFYIFCIVNQRFNRVVHRAESETQRIILFRMEYLNVNKKSQRCLSFDRWTRSLRRRSFYNLTSNSNYLLPYPSLFHGDGFTSRDTYEI